MGDVTAGLEKTLHHGGIAVRRIIIEQARRAGHGDAGDADGILKADGLARKGVAVGVRGSYAAQADDAVQRIVFRLGPGADLAGCLGKRAHGIGNLIQRVIGFHDAAHHIVIGFELGFG